MRCFACFSIFNVTATTQIYTLSLHDALPISRDPSKELAQCAPWLSLKPPCSAGSWQSPSFPRSPHRAAGGRDRKSTRLNSSHTVTSYAVFCLKKKTELSHQPAIPNITHPRQS